MARGQTVVRARRRRTHWTEFIGQQVVLSASVPTLLGSIGADHDGEMLIRTRGLLSLTLITAAAVGDGYVGAFGMGVVTTAAATAGVGSIPTSLTEAGWDGWFLHQYFDIRSGIGAGGPVLLQYALDSKAMRKISEDESIIMALEIVETGDASISVVSRTRILSMTN